MLHLTSKTILFCYDFFFFLSFLLTFFNARDTCSIQSIQTVSVPRIVRSKYQFNAGSRTNLIVIKPEKCKINEQKLFLKGWLTVFFLGLIVFMGCSLACVHAWFFKNALFFT